MQEILSKAVSTILCSETELTGAGRTDAGVHAKLMVAHLDIENFSFSHSDFVAKLNSILPKDIAVHKIVEVCLDAHARFDAILRTYEYHVVTSKNVFLDEFTARISDKLDFQKMNQAASKILEYQDFTSFSKLHTDVKTNICNVTHAAWTYKEGEWIFTIKADRFLRNMVRAIVGTLLEVGREKMSIEQFQQIIEAKDRCKAGASVPAKGLFLLDIAYPKHLFM